MFVLRKMTTLLVAGLAVASAAGELQAQQEGPPGGDQYADAGPGGEASPRITTGSTQTNVQPKAFVSIDRPAYVAIFEFKPGAGAVLLHPSKVKGLEEREAGEFRFPLNSRQVSNHRKRFYRHLGHRAERAGSIREWAYLLVVTSSQPFAFDRLRGDRVYEHHGSQDSGELVRGLIGTIVPEEARTGEAFGWDVHSFPKLRDRNYSPIADDPYIGGGGG